MSTIPELQSFHFVFQISKKIIFSVNYYLLDGNRSKYFSTSAAQFNQNKTDYNHCGQAQNELLKGAGVAIAFYKKWDMCHLKDLSPLEYEEVIEDIEKLKEAYNYKESPYDIRFSECKLLSMQPLKKRIKL